jgi:transcription antitermination factor NusG
MTKLACHNDRVGTYLFPPDLFLEDAPRAARQWTCVHTKPRWEKKLARWLTARGQAYYLPTYPRRTQSHRRVRNTALPLFPGYLFVGGDRAKGEFRDSKAVVGVIRPDSAQQHDRLDHDIWSIWRALRTGSHLELSPRLTAGQWVEVVSGPLKGVRGKFEKWLKGNRMIIGIDMLKVGVTVELPDTCVVVPID